MNKRRINFSWDPRFIERSAMFAPLNAVAQKLSSSGEWPSLLDYQKLVASRSSPIFTQNAVSLLPVAQSVNRSKPSDISEKYESRIFLRGELQIREQNWHDLFNLLVWMTFPNAKAALNARHYHELLKLEKNINRGPIQDALTLFDESGVIVASAKRDLTALLREREWKRLFWNRREDVKANMRFYLFGHGLYEKALQPFVGLTGRCIIVPAVDEFLTKTLSEQIEELDRFIASYVSDANSLASTSNTIPLPLLGVPDWCSENEMEAYYENESYFRKSN